LIKSAGVPTPVNLPSIFNYQSMYGFTGAVVGPDGYPRDDAFNFNFQNLSWIDGSGLTVFCNTLEWLHSHGVKMTFSGHDLAKNAIVYLDDCQFFARYLGAKLRPQAKARTTTLPFVQVAHADTFGWLEFTFTPWMSRVLQTNPASLGSVRACIKEVFLNISDHSSQSSGFVHVQHYPRANEVKVTLSDFGKGIPANIRTKCPDIDDGAAILRATQPGFTTKSTPRNMGVGLDFLIESVTGNKGSVAIYSFRGSLLCVSGGVTLVLGTRVIPARWLS
jgi:hypothetical protein